MAKTKTTETIPVHNPHKFVVDFWRYIELNAVDTNGLKTADRPYFGLKPSDTIQIPVKVGDQVQLQRTTVETVWRAICSKRRMLDASFVTPDLTMASFAARNDRQLYGWTVNGKQGGKFEGRKFGTKFWTAQNEKFVATPKTGRSTDGLQLANDFTF